MAMRYFIENGQTVSPIMSWDWDGAVISALFYDGAGLPVAPVGEVQLYASIYDSGDLFQQVFPFAADEWRFNGPCARVKVDLSAVTGYSTYRILIWRTDDTLPLTPNGAYTGEAAAVTQTYVEMNAKRGVQYEASRLLTNVAGLATVDSILKTGDFPVILKERALSYTGIGIRGEIYEAPTYTGGTADPYYNLSRINPVASTVQLLVGFSLSATGTKAFADDILIGNSQVQGQGATKIPIGHERIMKPNTSYLLRIVSLDSAVQNVAAYVSWYSGRLDAPLVRGL